MEAFHFVLNLRQSKQITDYYTQVLLRLSKLVPLQLAASTPHRNISTVQLHQKCRNKLFITFINMRTADHHRSQRNQLPVTLNIASQLNYCSATSFISMYPLHLRLVTRWAADRGQVVVTVNNVQLILTVATSH